MAAQKYRMAADRTYLAELAGVAVSNPLYAAWLEYAATITRADALAIVRGGLTHQARALRSMVREALGGRRDVPRRVYVKLEALVQATELASTRLRGG